MISPAQILLICMPPVMKLVSSFPVIVVTFPLSVGKLISVVCATMAFAELNTLTVIVWVCRVGGLNNQSDAIAISMPGMVKAIKGVVNSQPLKGSIASPSGRLKLPGMSESYLKVM